jgi:hypothetical protein
MASSMDFEAAMRVGATGNTAGLEEALREFGAEVQEAVASVGLDVAGDPFDADLERLAFHGELPVAPAREPVTVGAAAVAVVVFVGLKLADWAIGKVADGVWNRLSPALGRLFSRAAEAKPAAPLVVSLSAWFAESKVMVVVETTHREGVESIMNSACEKALAWTAANRSQNVKLIYRYADSVLSAEPLVVPV